MSLADIQSMKALKIAKQNAATLAGSQYTNTLSTSDFIGIAGAAGYPTIDNGSNDNNCPVSNSSAFPFQKYTVKAKQGRTYLVTVKIKGSTVTNTQFDLLPRYQGTATAVTGYAAPSGYIRTMTKTAPFDYQLLACVCTMNNTNYSGIDFTIALTQNNKDTVWSYKEFMVTDITGYTNAQIAELINYGYFASTVSKTKKVTPWTNKSVLAIGDSLTAALKWQNAVQTYHGCSVSTHAKGGIGLLQMVDGDGAQTDPILPLTVSEVTGKDLIILFGGMNERSTAYGVLGDVYPTNNTLFGRMQYVINKIYSLLQTANNLTCKILIVAPHCCGKYGFIDADGYAEYPVGTGQTLEKLVNNLKLCAQYNNLRVVDLWHDSGVGKNTWSVYMASSTPVAVPPTTNPYPNNADQVHFNDIGYALIGQIIAGEMNRM